MNKVAIYGGLGNQMFQYALCIALNQKGVKSRILFTHYLYSFYHTGFNLGNVFSIKFDLPSLILNWILVHGEFFYKNRISGFFLKRILVSYQEKKNKYLEKEEFEFDPEVFNQKEKILVGTWQAEDYFRDIKEIILREYNFRTPTDKINMELIEKIVNSNSVSIHVRRGDYLNDRWKNILGVIRGTVYYDNAISFINSKVKNPEYFVFSDDIKWAKENLVLDNCTYVDHNKGRNSYIDMYLMSICKHNIIANSTFSWWAAWLNVNPKKIVTIPEKWIIGKNCKQMYPEHWFKIMVE